MNEFQVVLSAIIPIFGIALVGLVIRRINWLNEQADESLLRVNVNLLLPCLILDASLGNTAFSRWQNLLWAPLIGYATVALGIFLALSAARLHRLTGETEKKTFALSVGLYNYGYIPLPLVLLLFDKHTVGVLFLHNVGVETALWTLGVWLLKGGNVLRDWRHIINAPLLAIVAALALNSLGLQQRVPEVLRTAIHWLGACAVPMALILIGAIVADYLPQFHVRSGGRVIGTAILLRLGVLPLAALLILTAVPLSSELKRVMVVEAAMPSAVFPILMARYYGGDPPTALRVVIGTSIAGLVTIPFWLRVGTKMAGL